MYISKLFRIFAGKFKSTLITMEELSLKEMLQKIAEFIAKYDDYNPTMDSEKHKTIGYYNAFYHMEDDKFTMVYKPSKTRKLPILIGGYGLLDNNKIYVVTPDVDKYDLEKCGEASIKVVYNKLTRNTNE